MANIKILEQKAEVVEEIKSNISNSSTSVWVEYRGLTVAETTKLRRELRENDADIKIYKNTLVTRALSDLNYDIESHLNGPKALVYGKDAVAPIKVVSDFAKKHPALEIKVGIVEGKIVGVSEIAALASLPNKEGMIGMFASGLISPLRNLAIAIDMIKGQK